MLREDETVTGSGSHSRVEKQVDYCAVFREIRMAGFETIMADNGQQYPRAPRSRRSRLLALLLWGGTAILLAVVVLMILKKRSMPVPELILPAKELAVVAVEDVVPCTYHQTLTLPARLEADRTASLSFENGGRLEKWLVAEGAQVAEGEIVAELNTDSLRADRAQLETRRQTGLKTVAVSEQDLEAAKVALIQSEKDAAALELELASTKAALELAEKEYERIRTLLASNIATQADFDTTANARTQATLEVAKTKDRIERAQVTVLAARTRLAQAEAMLALERSRVEETERDIEILDVNLGKMRLPAPFSGQLDEYLVETGEVVSPGQAVGILYDLSKVRASVDVPDRYIPLLDAANPLVGKYLALAMPGARQSVSAAVTVPGLPKLTGGTYAGVELPATVDRVAKAADPASNTFRVELLAENSGGALKQGIIVEACISLLEYPNAIVIPLKAIQVTDLGPRVFVVEENDGKPLARVRNIVPISIAKETILVQGELRPGEHLIVSGWKGLVDGEEVRVVILNGRHTPGESGRYPSMTSTPEPIHLPAANSPTPPPTEMAE